MLQSDIAVFRRAKAAIAESLWFEAGSGLHWSDLETGILHTSSLGGGSRDDSIDESDQVLVLTPPLSAFQPTSDGGFIVAGESTISVCARDGSKWRDLANIPPRHDGIRLNEGKCDPFGRFVVGSMDFLSGNSDGAIYSVTGDGRVRTIVDSIGVANGFEWSHDGSRMYFTDTSEQTVFVGDYSSTGELHNVEPFITGWQVDGLTKDIDGGFWAGIYDAGQVVHFAADGAKLMEIDLPTGHATAVVFGGEDFSTLYVATAREKLTEQQLEELPLTGSILQLQTDTRGIPAHIFDLNGHS
jgi:sugar lactone lactonase YvrE